MAFFTSGSIMPLFSWHFFFVTHNRHYLKQKRGKLGDLYKIKKIKIGFIIFYVTLMSTLCFTKRTF
jgi:hypothetical protein